MRYETVIFDLDGTLLNTLTDLTAAVNHGLTAFGLPERSAREVRTYLGNGLRMTARRAVPADTPEDLTRQVYETLCAYYADHALEATALYPQAEAALDALNAAGVRIAVVSNKADFAVQTLHKAFFAGRVRLSIGEREGCRRKPSPDMVELALRQLGAKRETAVYVGDSEVDAQTAQNSGLACILVDWGFRDRDRLEAFGFPVVSDAAGLCRAILGD
jgi:phosphoglycolate phosphatase